MLKCLIVPILFFGISSAISNSKNNTGRITIKTIVLFIIMFIASFLITYGVVNVIKPGANFTFQPVEWNEQLVSPSFKDFILAMFPSNIFTAMANNTILPVIIFAFVVGFAVKTLKNDNYCQFFEAGSKLFNKILEWVMCFTPIGVFALISNTVAKYGVATITSSIAYVGIAWLCCLLVLILVMIIPVWIACGISPIEYISKVGKVWLITLSSCSSAATLPTTIRTCNEDFNVPKEITDIVVPLGCTIHMCGGAVSFALLAQFNAEMFNIPITFGMFVVMLLAALLINMGAPGIPGGGIVIGATYLNLLNIPLDFIGFYAGIYRLLDMAYTTMNVTGDISANLLIHQSEIDKN